jgi:hypothetical protein
MLMWHGFDILLFDDIINPTTTTIKYFLGTHAHGHPSFGVHFMCCQNMLGFGVEKYLITLLPTKKK